MGFYFLRLLNSCCLKISVSALFNGSVFYPLQSKCVLLVTHQLQFLKEADLVVILNHGRVEAQGSYQQLLDEGRDLSEFIAKEKEPAETADDEYGKSMETTVRYEYC